MGTEANGELKFEATVSALKEILRLALLAGRPAWIRVGLRGGGCSGFSYVFEWKTDDGVNEERDYIFNYAVQFHSVGIVIDKKSMLYLRNTTLDFVTGIQGHGFKFNNPNVTNTCGCGESIEVK